MVHIFNINMNVVWQAFSDATILVIRLEYSKPGKLRSIIFKVELQRVYSRAFAILINKNPQYLKNIYDQPISS